VSGSTTFVDTFIKQIIQISGASSPLLANRIVAVNIAIAPPQFLALRPTVYPTRMQTLVPVDEQTPLEHTVTSAYVAKKTDKYFFSYVQLFMGIVAVLCVCRVLYLIHIYINRPKTLIASAASSSIYDPYSASLGDPQTRSLMLSRVDAKNEERRRVYRAVEEAALVKAGILHELSMHDSESAQHVVSRAIRQALERDDDEAAFDRELYEYVDMAYTLLDVEATIFPQGLKLPWSSQRLPPGLFEDYLLFTSNRHRLLSCIFSPVGSSVGAIYHTQMYLVKTAIAFSLSAIVNSIIKISGLPRRATQSLIIAFNIFCASPIAVEISDLGLKLISSVDAQDPTYKLKHPMVSLLLVSLSRLSLLVISGLVLGLLVVASLFSYHPQTLTFILVYIREVRTVFHR